jgi:hypothetical protein
MTYVAQQLKRNLRGIKFYKSPVQYLVIWACS